MDENQRYRRLSAEYQSRAKEIDRLGWWQTFFTVIAVICNFLAVFFALIGCSEPQAPDGWDAQAACSDYCAPNVGRAGYAPFAGAACVCEVPGVFLPLYPSSRMNDVGIEAAHEAFEQAKKRSEVDSPVNPD